MAANIIHKKEDILKMSEKWKDQSLSVAEIGELFGLNKGQMTGIATRNRDLFPKRKSVARNSHLVERSIEVQKKLNEGLSISQISRDLGIARGSVNRSIETFNLNKPKTPTEDKVKSLTSRPKRSRSKKSRVNHKTPTIPVIHNGKTNSIARQGHGYNVVSKSREYLHMSGNSLTKDRSFAWRTSMGQAEMISEIASQKLDVDLFVVKESYSAKGGR